jgi:hypothetical protein
MKKNRESLREREREKITPAASTVACGGDGK